MSTAHLHTIESKPLSKILNRIGNTTLLELNSFSTNKVRIFAKLEWEQLGGSVKARPAAYMIKDTLTNAPLKNGERLLEATSGNTGIALAQIAGQAGLPITIVLPKNAGRKRIELLEEAGAEIIFSSPLDGTDGAQILAKHLKDKYPGKYRYLDQYNNENNYRSHVLTTGPEIWKQTNGEVTHFITGLGTSGSFRGISTYLKDRSDQIKSIALQPDIPMHGLEGWKHMESARVPGIYDPTLADKQWAISTEEAFRFLEDAYRKERLWISPSSAANLAGAVRLAETLQRGTIVTLFPDAGTKYIDHFNPFAK